jgi:outer membrane protein, heavy metal efflux system
MIFEDKTNKRWKKATLTFSFLAITGSTLLILRLYSIIMRLMYSKRRNLLSLFIMLAIFVLSGCAGDYRPDTSWAERRSLGADLQAFVPPPATSGKIPEAVNLEDPTGPLTLRHALSLALMRNPALEGAAWEVRAGEAKTLQAQLPQNPTIGYQYGGLSSSTLVAQAASTEVVSQTFELGNKRAKQTKVSALETDLAGWEYETKRLDVLTEATKFFVEVLEAQEEIALYEELVRTSEQILAMAVQKNRTKKAPSPDIIKAGYHLSNVEIKRKQAQNKLEAARTRLAAAWGQKNPTFEKVEGVLTEVSAVPSLEELSELVSRNPDVARWKKETEQRRAALELEKSKIIPDVTLNGGAQQFDESRRNGSGVTWGVSMPIPIFDRNQGNTLAARYNLEKAGAESREAALKANTALGDAYQTLVSSYKEATGLKTDVLPAQERYFNAYTQIFIKKGLGLGEVLDASQTLFEARAKYIEILATYHKSKADVERLVGERLDSIMASRKEPTEAASPDHQFE